MEDIPGGKSQNLESLTQHIGVASAIVIDSVRSEMNISIDFNIITLPRRRVDHEIKTVLSEGILGNITESLIVKYSRHSVFGRI